MNHLALARRLWREFPTDILQQPKPPTGPGVAQERINIWIAAGDVDAQLYLSGLELTELPELPQTLRNLDCSINRLTNLQDLPNCTSLNCSENHYHNCQTSQTAASYSVVTMY